MSYEKILVIVIGVILIFNAIFHYLSKKTLSIYHNTRPLIVKNISDVTSYNHSTALLLLIYGLIFIGEGILFDKTFLLHITILTAVPGVLIIIAIYELLIKKRFQKR